MSFLGVCVLILAAFAAFRLFRISSVKRFRRSIERALTAGTIDERTAGYYRELVRRLPSVASRVPDPFASPIRSTTRSASEQRLIDELAAEISSTLDHEPPRTFTRE